MSISHSQESTVKYLCNQYRYGKRLFYIASETKLCRKCKEEIPRYYNFKIKSE